MTAAVPETIHARAVVFDLDGTLLDTLADLGESMNEVIAAAGFPPHPLGAYRRFVGDGVRNLASRALPAGVRNETTIDRCVDEMRRVYGARWDRKTLPYAGVTELLDQLTRRRLPLAVLSNKPHDLTTMVVAQLLPRWSFAAVVGQRVGRPRKPDPTSALEIAADLGVDSGSCVYVGDTDTDMKTAERAGMFAVGACWGFRDAAELEASGARALIRHPRELLELLEPVATP